MTKIPGLTDDEAKGLRMLLAFGIPGGRSKVQREIGKYLDGVPSGLDESAPTLKAYIDEAVRLTGEPATEG